MVGANGDGWKNVPVAGRVYWTDLIKCDYEITQDLHDLNCAFDTNQFDGPR